MYRPVVVHRWMCKTLCTNCNANHMGFISTFVSVELSVYFVRAVWCWDNLWKKHCLDLFHLTWILVPQQFKPVLVCLAVPLPHPYTDTDALTALGTLLPCSRSGLESCFRSWAGNKLLACLVWLVFFRCCSPNWFTANSDKHQGRVINTSQEGRSILAFAQPHIWALSGSPELEE